MSWSIQEEIVELEREKKNDSANYRKIDIETMLRMMIKLAEDVMDYNDDNDVKKLKVNNKEEYIISLQDFMEEYIFPVIDDNRELNVDDWVKKEYESTIEEVIITKNRINELKSQIDNLESQKRDLDDEKKELEDLVENVNNNKMIITNANNKYVVLMNALNSKVNSCEDGQNIADLLPDSEIKTIEDLKIWMEKIEKEIETSIEIYNNVLVALIEAP